MRLTRETYLEREKLQVEKLEGVRDELRRLDRYADSQSKRDEYREYAIHCLSDANSITNRKWRIEFMRKRLAILYEGHF